MGDELGPTRGSRRRHKDRRRIFGRLGRQTPRVAAVGDQHRPRQGASKGAAWASDEAPLASEDLRLDRLDLRIKLLLAEIESRSEALKDLAQFSRLEPQVRRTCDGSDAKA